MTINEIHFFGIKQAHALRRVANLFKFHLTYQSTTLEYKLGFLAGFIHLLESHDVAH